MGGIALSTAVQALFYRLGLQKPWDQASTPAKPILIWAASTSVGLFAVALAKLANPENLVIATASPHNFALLRELGANAVFDYRDADVSAKIKKWVESKGIEAGIEKAFDCFSEGGKSAAIFLRFGPRRRRLFRMFTFFLVAHV